MLTILGVPFPPPLPAGAEYMVFVFTLWYFLIIALGVEKHLNIWIWGGMAGLTGLAIWLIDYSLWRVVPDALLGLTLATLIAMIVYRLPSKIRPWFIAFFLLQFVLPQLYLLLPIQELTSLLGRFYSLAPYTTLCL